MKRILVVCTGNICRSPMAEGLLKKLLSEKGVDGVEVGSAGTYALTGYPAEPLAQQVMKPLGVDISSHRARTLSPELIHWADRILVMTQEHREVVEEIVPDAQEKVRFLGSYGPGSEPDRPILDPYGGSGLHYRTCVVEIVESVSGFLADEADSIGI